MVLARIAPAAAREMSYRSRWVLLQCKAAHEVES